MLESQIIKDKAPQLEQKQNVLPRGTLVTESSYGEMATRAGVLERKKHARANKEEASQEFKSAKGNAQAQNHAVQAAQEFQAEEAHLENLLQSKFIPQHSPTQLISPSAFFVSPLFCVRSKRAPRKDWVTFEMVAAPTDLTLKYRGPELRQSDGLVFMALLNLARDVQVGQHVSFSPEELCHAVFGRYDGPARKSLKEHIHRLQSALVEFSEFTVQLCLRFSHSSKGPWKVALDEDIVRLFSQVRHVWLELQQRKSLPEGLATWLYGFIESQSSLIPTSVETLHRLCGSEASTKSFTDSLRETLHVLANQGVLDEGWSLKGGKVKWRKAMRKTTEPAM